jgi:hypothetical protein
MQKTGEIGTGRKANAGPRLFDCAGTADPFTRFQNQNTFSGAGKVCRAGEAVVPGSNYNHVPALRGKFADGNRKTD